MVKRAFQKTDSEGRMYLDTQHPDFKVFLNNKIKHRHNFVKQPEPQVWKCSTCHTKTLSS